MPPVDLSAAAEFMAAHARVLDRRRFDHLVHGGDPHAALAALDSYRNADGGYGYGLEPDLRSRGSQPIAALHAFEVFAECADAGAATPAVDLCDWLATVSFDDGGLPFVLPIDDAAACAPWFTGADPTTSSLHGTLAVVSAAWRVARGDAVVAGHPWLARATRFCLDRLAHGDVDGLHAYELAFGLRLLAELLHAAGGPGSPAAGDAAEAAGLLARLAAALPPDGALPVAGGVEGEAVRVLFYGPRPDSHVRRYVAPEAVDAELDRLAAEQQADGGWDVDFASFSPAARVEWRGYTTVHAVDVLAANGRLVPST